MIREERNQALLGYASQMDEEGPKVGPTRLTASLMLSKGHRCMESVQSSKEINVISRHVGHYKPSVCKIIIK